MVQMSLMSRNVITPGNAMPGSAGRIGCEPVANTSLEKARDSPSARLTLRALVSIAVARQP